MSLLEAMSSWPRQLTEGNYVELALRGLLGWIFRFRALQDLLLLHAPLQRTVLLAYRRRHAATVSGALRTPPAATFDHLDYYVDPASRQVLQFAALHALSAHLQAEEVLAPAQLLPQVSRVLLQIEEPQAGKMLEAVAGALAAQMSAGLLLVDAMLLATLASDALGKPPEAFLAGFSGSGGGGSAPRASPALELAWKALRGVLLELERPTVVFIRSAEQLLCSSFEAHAAFQAAFGTEPALALEGEAASRAPLVLLGGVCVDESAAARAGRGHGHRQGQPGFHGSGLLGGGVAGGDGDEDDGSGDSAGQPKGRGRGGLFGSGAAGGSGDLDALDDDLGLGDLLLSLSKLAGDSQRPNARKLLLKVFPTRVKLQPPPAGPLALRHMQRLQADAAEAAEEDNYRAASAVAASTGVAIPPKSSGVYAGVGGGRALGRTDWRKVLSWAVAMETLQQKQRQMEEERSAEDAQEAQALAALCQEAAAESAAGEAAAAGHLTQRAGKEAASGKAAAAGPATLVGSGAGLRRRQHGQNGGAAAAARRGSGSRQQLLAAVLSSLLALASSLWQLLNPLRLAAAAVALPRRAVGSMLAALVWCLTLLPVFGPIFEESLSEARLEAELQELEAELEELQKLTAPDRDEDGDGSEGGAGSVRSKLARKVAPGGGTSSSSGTLRLSEAALRYGLGMLQRSSGGPKQAVEPSNRYEKRLLAEVLSPEECGRGFSEVGALGDAKAALREAVQLPLQHPELFAGGTLARPSKGVLLFGPPGTGKTLVARAAAAECGAAFLALNISSVTSKWFGDSTKLLRAAFSLAAKLAPCVIFIDEVDALLGKRNSLKEHEALREMKNEMMAQWDGIRPGRERVMVLGATNRPFDLDDAVLRRFTHRIFVGLPDRAARAAILQVVLEGEKLGADVSVARLAELTEGYSGSDLKQLCVQAAMRPVRSFLEQSSSFAAPEEAAEDAAGAEPAAVKAGHEEPAAEAGGSEADANVSAGEGAAAAEDGGKAAAAAGALGSQHGEASVASPVDVPPLSAGTAGGEQPPQPPLPAASSHSEAASGSTATSSVATSLHLVPRLDSLLRQAERIASAPHNPKTDLRPISMQDFEAALREVGASVNPDSAVIQELNEWNAQFGTTGNKVGVQSKRLSYFS